LKDFGERRLTTSMNALPRVTSVLFVTLALTSRWPISASTIVVTDPSQKDPQTIGGPGCSLVEAIYSSDLQENLAIDTTSPDHFITTDCTAGGGNDTIVLPAGAVFKMSKFLDGDAYNPYGFTATPIIFSNVTIEGNGATIEWTGSGNVRLFAVGPASIDITSENRTVSGTGTLTLKNVYIKGFQAKGGDGADGGGGELGAGGAIYLQYGKLTVKNCTFDSNGAIGGNGAAGVSGGGGGMGGNGGGGNIAGGGGGGARGDGAHAATESSCPFDPYECFASGGGGGIVFGGSGVLGGFPSGGDGTVSRANQEDNGHDATGPGGGGGGGAVNTLGLVGGDGSGGNGQYGGGGGGGVDSAGSGGFGGGGGGGELGNYGSGSYYGGDGSTDGGGGGGALGGAISSDSGSVDVENSTFYNNFVSRGVGDPHNGGDAGGAIFSRNGSVTILNCTISGNQSTGSGAGVVVFGENAAILNLKNTIVANNAAPNCPTCYECFFRGNVTVSGDGNLIVLNGSGTQPFGKCPGVVTSDDPQLGTLQLNDPGATPTMAIIASSSAFDAGVDLRSSGITTDQRGVLRPQNVAFDIGAYELLVNRPPVAQCQNVTVFAGANCTADASIDNGSSDPDPGDTIQVAQSPVGPYSLGTTSVTLTVTDSFGATDSCTATVTVTDSTPPTVNCPSGITQSTDPGKCTATVTFSASATDNCTQSVGVTCTPASGSAFSIGTTPVTCQATDGAGNTGSCSFNVTVTVGNRCPHPQGYWKNNAGLWPVNALPITLGRQTYSKTELLALLNSPSMSDATLILARQLIAAILNTARGSDPTPICSVLSKAQTQLSAFNGKLPYKVSPSSSKGNPMVNVSNQLDSYNNGQLTPACVP
jgi:hypothetical protein